MFYIILTNKLGFVTLWQQLTIFKNIQILIIVKRIGEPLKNVFIIWFLSFFNFAGVSFFTSAQIICRQARKMKLIGIFAPKKLRKGTIQSSYSMNINAYGTDRCCRRENFESAKFDWIPIVLQFYLWFFTYFFHFTNPQIFNVKCK